MLGRNHNNYNKATMLIFINITHTFAGRQLFGKFQYFRPISFFSTPGQVRFNPSAFDVFTRHYAVEVVFHAFARLL
jgi:hypothetical protein